MCQMWVLKTVYPSSIVGKWVPGFSEIKLMVFQHFFCSPVLVEVIDTHYLYLIWK